MLKFLTVFFLLISIAVTGQANELSTLIKVALKNNYKIRNSEFEITSSEYDNKQGLSAFYPEITASANTTWNESKTSPHTSGANTQNSYNSNGYNVSLTQKIIDFTSFIIMKSPHLSLKLIKLSIIK